MSANGISTLATKELKQKAKLDLVALKRQGNVLNNDGTVYSAPLGSAQFSGSNYLSVAGGAGTAMGTGDFTWECWVYPTSSSDYQCFIDTRTSPLEGGDNTGFFFGTNLNTLSPIYYTTNLQLESTESMTLNAWNHVALTRNSGTVTLWVNGTSGGTQSNATDLTQQRVFIGGDGLGGALNLTGNISNLRIVKGQALYTNNFTPSTSTLTAVAGTQLLLLNGATEFVDGSSNQFTITNSGGVTLSTTAPTLIPATPAYRTRATYDITQLPTQYNDNDIIDNPNAGGLVVGRPWVIGSVETQLETFTVVQTTDWTAPAGTTSVEYLVVGGGGGGGNGYDTGGGGGGAGGMMLTGTLAVTPGQTYTVIVGDGGTGGADERVNNAGTAGSNSVFATITALGGTGGQGSRTYSPTARYTGGAAQVGSSTAPLGGGGGGAADAGGGGGGAGSAGGTRVSASSAGVGGAGVASLITGSSVTYGRGGAGGTSNVNNNDGAVGANNTGTGGGGGSATAGNSGGGGNGGSGIVVLKFTTPAEFTFYEAFGTTTAIETTQYVSGNKIYAYASTYDVPDFQPARVVVNDIEVLLRGDTPLPNGRGHNMVVLDTYGDVVTPAATYDTYIDPDNLTALASALNAVASGNIVVLVTYDASALDAGVRSAINTGYGSTNTDTWTAQRKSHIFIGVKI